MSTNLDPLQRTSPTAQPAVGSTRVAGEVSTQHLHTSTRHPSKSAEGGTASGPPRGAAARGVVQFATAAASAAVSVVVDVPGPWEARNLEDNSRRLRGIFLHQSWTGFPSDADLQAQTANKQRGDFRQRLDNMLASEDRARRIAIELYTKSLDGDLRRLPDLLQLMQERWNFPERVFPLLKTQLRRVGGITRDQHTIAQKEWGDAFVRWLQVLHSRTRRTKVTRKRLIQKHADEDVAKIYQSGKKLGEGSFGEVYLARHVSLDAQRVIKSMSREQLSLMDEQVETEVDTLRSLDHPHIIRIFEAFETDSKLHIVMDYAAGGDLSDAILQAQDAHCLLPEAWSRRTAEQIASALDYMHSKGVIHCDLKPGNTMLLHPFVLSEAASVDPHVLVADFGLAELFEHRQGAQQVKGSPLYLAPEGFEGMLSQYSDMWALGCMIYELLLNRRAFKGCSNLYELFCQVANTDVTLDGIPPLAQELVAALLQKDPKTRPSAKVCLRFAWFREVSQETTSDMRKLQACCKISSIGHQSYFQRAVMFCVAASLGMSDVTDLYDTFKVLDVSRTGYVTAEDLRQGLLLLGITQDPDTLMHVLDLDQDGEVSYTEFLAGALRLGEDRAEKLLRYAFTVFDADADDHLNMHELRLMLSGDGPLADVLPDGRTVEDVMEEISGGEGRISFHDFKAFVERNETRESFEPDRDEHLLSTMQCSSTHIGLLGESDLDHTVAALLAELFGDPRLGMSMVDGRAISSIKEKEKEKFPSLLEWMSQLYDEAQAGAKLSRVLRFPDPVNEANYVTHYLPRTCQQISLLAAALVVYSVWALFSENYAWDPSVARWDLAPRIANNIAWILLALMGTTMITVCWLRYLKRAFMWIPGKRFELGLCVWACLVPFISCFFANRHRCAYLFGYTALDVFVTVNSDYDLIVVMLAALMFLGTRTNLRFVLALPIAVSCVFAYGLSSILSHTPAWPAILQILVTYLVLTGHASVERRKRLTFLSFEASYQVLKELHDDPGLADAQTPTVAAETRTARLKQALDLVRRLSASADLANQPLRMALTSLAEVLEHTRDDIAHADRLLTVDLRETLDNYHVVGAAGDLLLNLLEAPPRQGCAASQSMLAMTRTSFAHVSKNTFDEAWGWSVLPAEDGAEVRGQRPLQVVSDLIVNAAVAAANTPELDTRLSVKRAASRFIDDLLVAYSAEPSTEREARAALAVHAAHWLARSIGLWQSLRQWDRLALLVAAAGMHSEAKGPGGGVLLSSDPLLRPAASVVSTLAAIRRSGIGSGAPGGCDGFLDIVRRLMSRSRPRCALEDARRVRVALENDDNATEEESVAICGLVLAAADLAFLALPKAMHHRWAHLCRREGDDIRAGLADVPTSCLGDTALPLDVAAWLRGLIEAVALPVYETLLQLDGCETPLAGLNEPIKNLRDNAKHWRVTQLVVPGKSRGSEEGAFSPLGGTSHAAVASLRAAARAADGEPVPIPELPVGIGAASLGSAPSEASAADAATLLSSPASKPLSLPARDRSAASSSVWPQQHPEGAGDFLQRELLMATTLGTSTLKAPDIDEDVDGGTVIFSTRTLSATSREPAAPTLDADCGDEDTLGGTLVPGMGERLLHIGHGQPATPEVATNGNSLMSDAVEDDKDPANANSPHKHWPSLAALPGQIGESDGEEVS